MPDPNPYESPKVEQPLRPGQIVKRGIGVGLILLLTPPAMVIAVLTSCTALFRLRLFGSLMALFVGFPFAILTALMIWAAILEGRKDDINRAPRRIGWLLATPVAFLIAAAVGYGLAALTVITMSEASGGLSPTGVGIGLVLFWLLPSLTLFVMLWFAWRAE